MNAQQLGFLDPVASMYVSRYETKKATQVRAFKQRCELRLVTYQEACEMQKSLTHDLDFNDRECCYWIDCMADLVKSLRLQQQPQTAGRTLSIQQPPALKGWHKRKYNELTPQQRRAVEQFAHSQYWPISLQSCGDNLIRVVLGRTVAEGEGEKLIHAQEQRIEIVLTPAGAQHRYTRLPLEQIA